MSQCKQITHKVELSKRLFFLVVAAVATASSIRGVPYSQDAAGKRRAFEVASVKWSDPNSHNFGIGTAPGG
jgi:hypothetical protein